MTPAKQFQRGIDSGIAKDPRDVLKNGGSFIVRYSAGAATDPSHPDHAINAWKLCGLGEISAASAAGCDFFANSEWYEDRVTEGYAAGHQDGLVDLAFWKARGLARGACVYYSWDKAQPDTTKHAGLAEYFRGVKDAFAGYYKRGLYAGNVAIEAMLNAGAIDFGWLAMSTSWSKPLILQYQPGGNWTAAAQAVAPKTRASLWQNGNKWYSNQADEDVILHTPHGSHFEALGQAVTSPPPAPAPKTVVELAHEVIAGQWGNGDDRKNRLTAAGYNYQAVQDEVNKELGITPAPKLLDVHTVAEQVIHGDWGNGAARKSALTKAGYNYDAVQAEVNRILAS